MSKLLAFRLLCCCVVLVAGTAGCSCSSHIPESPPGDGPVGEIKNLQTGEVVSGSNPAAAPVNPQSAPNFNRPPMPGQPAPVKPQTTGDTIP